MVEKYTNKNSIKIQDSINKGIEKPIVYTISKSIKYTSIIITTIEKLNANKLLEYKNK